MNVMLLNGTHVGKTLTYLYKSKSWGKDAQPRLMILKNIGEVTHKREGGVYVAHRGVLNHKDWRENPDQATNWKNSRTYTIFTYDQEVEVID